MPLSEKRPDMEEAEKERKMISEKVSSQRGEGKGKVPQGDNGR